MSHLLIWSSKFLLGRPSWKDFSLPIKFPVNGPFCSGEEVQNRVSRWQLWWPFCISDRNDFNYFFLSTSHPGPFYQVSNRLTLQFRTASEIKIFKVADMVPILDFLLEGLTIFDLQVIPMLPTKFQIHWPYGSGKEAKDIFSRWQPCSHHRFPIGIILAFVYLQITLKLSTKFQLAFRFKKNWKNDIQDGGNLGFLIRRILAIFDIQVTTTLPTKFQINWPFN